MTPRCPSSSCCSGACTHPGPGMHPALRIARVQVVTQSNRRRLLTEEQWRVQRIAAEIEVRARLLPYSTGDAFAAHASNGGEGALRAVVRAWHLRMYVFTQMIQLTGTTMAPRLIYSRTTPSARASQLPTLPSAYSRRSLWERFLKRVLCALRERTTVGILTLIQWASVQTSQMAVLE